MHLTVPCVSLCYVIMTIVMAILICSTPEAMCDSYVSLFARAHFSCQTRKQAISRRDASVKVKITTRLHSIKMEKVMLNYRNHKALCCLTAQKIRCKKNIPIHKR